MPGPLALLAVACLVGCCGESEARERDTDEKARERCLVAWDAVNAAFDTAHEALWAALATPDATSRAEQLKAASPDVA